MTITLPPDVEQKVREKAAAEGVSIEAYVADLIRQDDEWVVDYDAPEMDENDPDFEETRAAVMEGLEQAERGEGTPAREFFAELRAKRGVSR